jgi:GTP-binding protein
MVLPRFHRFFSILNPKKIRNVAIIAHVDHGKTTLLNSILSQTQHFAESMDVNTLEKERGITIVSKVTSLDYKNHKFNIVDTPGHAGMFEITLFFNMSRASIKYD